MGDKVKPSLLPGPRLSTLPPALPVALWEGIPMRESRGFGETPSPSFKIHSYTEWLAMNIS